jgi:hypothetical protein
MIIAGQSADAKETAVAIMQPSGVTAICMMS